MKYLRILKNKLLLRLGFMLVNKHGYTVHLDKYNRYRQIRSNYNRKTDYSMDDPSWKIISH